MFHHQISLLTTSVKTLCLQKFFGFQNNEGPKTYIQREKQLNYFFNIKFLKLTKYFF